MTHTIAESTELIRSNFHKVTNLVAESHAVNISFFHRSKHCAQKQNGAVRLFVMLADHLFV